MKTTSGNSSTDTLNAVLERRDGIGAAVRGLLNVLAEQAPAQAAEAPRPLIEQGRYQLICANGCGRCGIKLSEFEYERTETVAGELVSRKTIPQIVSACCGHEVEVWDEVAQDNMPHKIMAVTVDQLYSHSGPAPYSGDWIAARDVNRLVRELDVALNGEAAARQASLVDIVAQVKLAPAGYALMPVEPEQKMAPVQGYPGGIPWAIHLEAYAVYSKKWSPQPALIDLEGKGCRGGFSTGELDEWIPGWRDRVSEFGKLQAEVQQLRARLAATAQEGGAA